MKISMERFGETGWQFEVNGTEYRTDKHGGGLWEYMPTGAWYPDTNKSVYEFKQTLGTSQFSLSTDRKRAYGQIRYRWTLREE
jgi:hypothetical protein